jgi:Ohr subfamily peroxiredoxin
MTAAYKAEATSRGGRDGGQAGLKEGGLYIAMAIQKELGGAGNGSNPEQLFALGYATCFNSALLLAAHQQKVDAGKATVTAEVGIGKDATSFALEVELKVHVPGMDVEKARALAEAAHQLCPYSKATRNNIPVTLTVV